MAFPSSPTNGQVYQGKVYNATTGTWGFNNYSGICMSTNSADCLNAIDITMVGK